jgi:hypothetical protein
MHADEVARARNNKLSKTWNVNPVLAEIVTALLDLNGAAHGDVVVEAIARQRGAGRPSEGFRREVYQAVDIHCEKAKGSGRPPLLHRPFGPESKRWALLPDVLTFMSESRAKPTPPERRELKLRTHRVGG